MEKFLYKQKPVAKTDMHNMIAGVRSSAAVRSELRYFSEYRQQRGMIESYDLSTHAMAGDINESGRTITGRKEQEVNNLDKKN